MATSILFDLFGTLVDYEPDRSNFRFDSAVDALNARYEKHSSPALTLDTYVSAWERAFAEIETKSAAEGVEFHMNEPASLVCQMLNLPNLPSSRTGTETNKSAFHEKTAEALHEKTAEALHEKTAETLDEKTAEALHEKTAEALDEKTAEALHEKTAEALDEKTVEALVEDYMRVWITGIREIPGAATLVKRLARHYSLGLITNTHYPPMVDKLLLDLGLDGVFCTVVTSVRFGRPKPNPSIFQFALDEMNVSAADATYIGDSFEHDYKGATAMGMNCYLIGSHARVPRTRQLRSLLDLSLHFRTER